MALYKWATKVAWSAGAGFVPSNTWSVGQILTKTATGYDWETNAWFSPENTWSTGQVLTKTATGYNYQDVPSELPSGWSTGQILKKTASGTEWASITEPNVIAMTQDAYDALPEATKNDGKLRIITDASGIEMADKAYVDWLVGDVESLLAAI